MTATNARPATAARPIPSASLSLPVRSALMVRALPRIQKIIQVTIATATSDVTASKIPGVRRLGC
jgi:hypothetical protein